VDAASAILNFITALALPVLGFLGIQQYVIQPRHEARATRRKYATALYIACKELSLHLAKTLDKLQSTSSQVGSAMKKVPNNDFNDNPAWFTKDGYYATITAYKIAAVSAWLRVYQTALLFSSYPESQAFLNDIYRRGQNLKVAFSTNTCLWYYYFDAIGERLIVNDRGTAATTRTFSEFCSLYAHDKDFRLFFEQLHMYLWFLGHRDQRYLDTIPAIQECLKDLIHFLENRNLLPGFRVDRPDTEVGELDKAKLAGWDVKSS
jgi:hypothetical protein